MSLVIRSILLGTDFSPCAERAFEYALLLAARWKAELIGMTVLEFYPGMDPEYPVNKLYLDNLREDAIRRLEAVQAKATEAGKTCLTRIDLGIPSEAIKTAAEATGADLLVVGTHGRTGLDHVLLGSTAERVARIAPCPVLSVKATPRPPAAIGRIVVPIDLSAPSLDALEYATHFAKQIGASVTILHVMEPVAYGLDFSLTHARESQRQRDYLENRLKVLSSILTAQGLKNDYVLKPGLPLDAIVTFVQQHEIDLIIMGTHGRRGLSHLLLGSIAEAMLRHAPCPVLTVRAPHFGPDHERVVPLSEPQHV
jgi:nucleotide-binding universal stress UspA family protein